MTRTDNFKTTVSKLAKTAKENLISDGEVDFLVYFDCPKQPLYLFPKFRSRADIPKIQKKVIEVLAKETGSYYVVVAEADNPKNENERFIIVHGFHRDGRFLNITMPFIEIGNKFCFEKKQTSTDRKTIISAFADLFDKRVYIFRLEAVAKKTSDSIKPGTQHAIISFVYASNIKIAEQMAHENLKNNGWINIVTEEKGEYNISKLDKANPEVKEKYKYAVDNGVCNTIYVD